LDRANLAAANWQIGQAGHGRFVMRSGGARKVVTAIGLLLALLLPARPAWAETLLRARLNADIISTMPGMRRDENTDAVMLHIVEGLVASREDGSVGPMLAKSWSVSQDGRVYSFALRDDVVFHNGAPLTADDVLWSFHWYLEPANHWRCLSALHGTVAKILSVTAPDRMTVRIALDRPAPLFLKTLSRADCGGTGILQRASVAADGVSWIRPIGTGPFMLGDWQHGNYLELLRFPHYAALPGPGDGNTGGKHALVDRIRFLIIPDSSAAAAALMRGNLDMTDALDTNQLGIVRRDPAIRLLGAPTLDFYPILFQTGDPVLKDVRMRQAIVLTIDRDGLARAATNGTALADASPVPVASPFYGPAESAVSKPDIAKARRLAAASGYKGQPIVLIANRRYPQLFDAAVLVQAMAAQAGINFQIQTVDWATQVSLYASGKYQAMVFAFSAKLDPSLNFDLLIGDKTKDARKVWDSKESRALYKQTVEAGDPAARQAAFDRLNAAFLADAPAVVLFNSRRIGGVRANVHGYKPWPAAQQRLWNVGIQ
jgi:peptide/nickel transport system substrate-binding protein